MWHLDIPGWFTCFTNLMMATQLIRRLSLCSDKTRTFLKLCRSFHKSRALLTDTHYDVIITGGGMVGSAMAAALGKQV